MQVFSFAPSNQTPYQFQPTLDGDAYNAVVTWNVAGERYYLTLSTLTGDVVFTLPLIGSAAALEGQSASWANGRATIVTKVPHGIALGQTVRLKAASFSPDAYNGTRDMFAAGPAALAYPLDDDPGTSTVPGTVGYDVSMTAGYFASTLVYREAAQQFEVSP